MIQSIDAFLIDKSLKKSSSISKVLKNIHTQFNDGHLLHEDFTDMDFCIYFLKKLDKAYKEKMDTSLQ